MAITNKTRKKLWGKSGNRCAISKVELVFDPTDVSDESIIADECHIYAQNPNGPRYNPDITGKEIDNYENLILLSKNYHKIVDDNPTYYTPEKLKDIKRIHEDWVRDTLDFEIRNVKSKKNKDMEFPFLSRLHTGSEALNIVASAHMYDFDNDELENEEEVDIVGSFLQNVQDWGEMFSEIESSERVSAKYTVSQMIKELEDNGFWVFGGSSKKKTVINNKAMTFDIATLRVIRSNNPTIIAINFDKESVKNKDTEQGSAVKSNQR